MQARNVILLFSTHTELVDLVGPLEVLRYANHLSASKETLYKLTLIGATSDVVSMSHGVKISPDYSVKDVPKDAHTLVVVGGAVDVNASKEQRSIADWLQIHGQKATRVASVCTGAFTLAAGGFLDGKSATTHWSVLEQLQQSAPRIRTVDGTLFVRDGKVITSAGLSAGVDMMLSLVEEDFGHRLAMRIAEFMVVGVGRPGGLAQAPTPHLRAELENDGAKSILDTLRAAPSRFMRAPDLAQAVHMSERSLYRVCKEKFGITPKALIRREKCVEVQRLLGLGLSQQQAASEVGVEVGTLRKWQCD